MSKLLDYLNDLDKDAAAREAHAKDPTAAMTKFGLTADEQVALMSGDKKKVAALVGIHEDSLPSIQVLITTFDPNGWIPLTSSQVYMRHPKINSQATQV